MTAEQAVRYIEEYTWSTTRLGLDRTRELLHKLGDPQKKLKFIHVAGSNGKGSSESEALTVSQAKASIGEEDVWVSGYVVGGDLTSASASFEEPFTSRTNLILGSRSSTSDRESCISVALPSGDVRDNLNLVDNPSLLGKKICVRGDVVETYYGLVGIKNVDDFKIL